MAGTKLDGKVVVVTGGNSGIGLAAAKAFAAEGARVVLAARDKKRLEAAAKDIPGALAVACDVSKLGDLDRLAALAGETFGTVHALFINAGVLEVTPVTKTTEAQLDFLMDINFKGSFFTIQKLIPLMKDGGSIILNTSVASTMGLAGMSVYSASKAAVASLAKTLSAELAKRGIRVNVLSPGPVETPMFEAVAGSAEGMREAMAGKTLIGRVARPEELARAAVFLASDDSSYVVGAELVADGGMSVAR